MKCIAIWALCAFLLCAPALAMESLTDAVLIGDGLIYYGGSLDGKTQGLFAMNMQGENARLLLEGEAFPMAGNRQTVLVCRYQENGPQALLLDSQGNTLLQLDTPCSRALENEGVYYLGRWVIREENGQYAARSWMEISPEDEWMIEPVWAQGNFLYYLDSTLYGRTKIYDSEPVARLMRYDVSSGAHTLISPEGTNFLGLDQGRAVYTRSNFYIFTPDGREDAVMVENGPGLYMEGADGKEVFLAPIAHENYLFTQFSRLHEGVVYGLTVDYSLDNPTATLDMVTLEDGSLRSLSVPAGDLAAVQDGAVYLAQSHFKEEEGAFFQEDHLLKIDPQTGASLRLNPDRRESLIYSELPARFVVQEGRIYYTDFSLQRSAIRLLMINLDGSGYAQLAQGKSWLDAE